MHHPSFLQRTVIEKYNGEGMTSFSEWPTWLQTLVLVPNGVLAWLATWIWWPKDGRGWRKFGWVAAYLLTFYLVMHFGFHAFK